MASFIYNSCVEDLANNNIDFGADTFKLMLVTSSYTADKDAHDRRNDVTNQVEGSGYTAGGATTTCSIVRDDDDDKLVIAFSAVTWETATITARGGVIYKSTGTAADDPLVGYIDFGGNVSSTAASFSVGISTITLQN